MIAVISIMLWSFSMALPAIYPSPNSNDPIFGQEILLLGWMIIAEGMFPWYANIFLLIGNLLLIFSNSKTTALSVLAFICLLDLIRFCYFPTFHYPLESIHKDFKFGIGAYIWMISIGLFIIASVFRNNYIENIKHNKSFKPTPKSGAV